MFRAPVCSVSVIQTFPTVLIKILQQSEMKCYYEMNATPI